MSRELSQWLRVIVGLLACPSPRPIIAHHARSWLSVLLFHRRAVIGSMRSAGRYARARTWELQVSPPLIRTPTTSVHQGDRSPAPRTAATAALGAGRGRPPTAAPGRGERRRSPRTWIEARLQRGRASSAARRVPPTRRPDALPSPPAPRARTSHPRADHRRPHQQRLCAACCAADRRGDRQPAPPRFHREHVVLHLALAGRPLRSRSG